MESQMKYFVALFGVVFLTAGSFGIQKTPSIEIHYDYRFGGLDVPENQIFDVPIDLAVGPENRIYLLDSGDSNIKVFTDEGEYISTFGGRGSGPGEFNRPWTFAFIQEHLYVVDSSNRRIQIFSPDGKYLRGYKATVDFGTGMAFGSDGFLYVNTHGFRSPKLIKVLDTQGHQVNEFGDVDGEPFEFYDFTAIKNDIKNGTIPTSFRNDVLPVVADDGSVWAVYRGMPKLKRYSREGKSLADRDINVKAYEAIYNVFREENKKIEDKPSMFQPLRYVNDAAFDGQGDLYLLLNIKDRMTFIVFDAEGNMIKLLLGPQDYISRFAFDLQGRLFALGSESHLIYRFNLR